MNPLLVTLCWYNASRVSRVSDVYYAPNALGLQDDSRLRLQPCHSVFPLWFFSLSLVFRHIWTRLGSISWLYMTSKTVWSPLRRTCVCTVCQNRLSAFSFIWCLFWTTQQTWLWLFNFFLHVIYSCILMCMYIFHPTITSQIFASCRQAEWRC